MTRTRKFKVGVYTRVFEPAGQYGTKTEIEAAKRRLGNNYNTRTTRIKIRDYAKPKRYQLWKKKKMGR